MIRSIRVNRPLMVIALIMLGAVAAAFCGLELVTEREVIHLWAATDLADFAPVLDEKTQSHRSPWGLAVDPSGFIYITDSARGIVHVLHPEEELHLRVQLQDAFFPSFPAPLGEELFFYEQHRDELVRVSIGDLRKTRSPDPDGRGSLADLFAGFVEDFTGVRLDDQPGVNVFRLESVGCDHLFAFAELITDGEIYRLAVRWPVDDPHPARVKWVHLAQTRGEDVGEWSVLLPGREGEAGPAGDATAGGSLLRRAGGPFLWELEFPGGDTLTWETRYRVSPHIIGEGPEGGLWLAERRPVQREGLTTTAFSSGWTLNLVTAAGDVLESIWMPWPEDWRSGPKVTVTRGSLYVLYPANDGTVSLSMIRVEKRWRWRTAGMEDDDR